MRRRKTKSRGAAGPLRYWPILLIAAAITESVHAPSIRRSNASTPKPEANLPISAESSSPSGVAGKKPDTLTVNPAPTSDDTDSTSKAIEQFMFPAPQELPVQPDLLPAVPDGPQPFVLDSSLPSVGGEDPLVKLPPNFDRHPVDFGFDGLVASNGIKNEGPVQDRNPLITTPVAAVPEPAAAMIMAAGMLGFLRRRSRHYDHTTSSSILGSPCLNCGSSCRISLGSMISDRGSGR